MSTKRDNQESKDKFQNLVAAILAIGLTLLYSILLMISIVAAFMNWPNAKEISDKLIPLLGPALAAVWAYYLLRGRDKEQKQ